MENFNILAVGEVLFDVIKGDYKLGGAPFNVAAHMAKLGHKSFILSGVGNDALGHRILQEAEQLHVATDFIHRHPALPTGTVQVKFEDGEPHYEIIRDVAWDELEVDFQTIQQRTWEVVVFGSLAQRSQHNRIFFDQLFHHLNAKWTYFDCNLRQDYYDKKLLEGSFQWANICKFNEKELEVCSGLLYDQKMEAEDFAIRIHQDFGIQLVVYTWGKEGSKAWYEGTMYAQASESIQVADTIGAGDAFNAGFLNKWISGGSVEESLVQGNKLGAFVASHTGAIPEYTAEIWTIMKK